MHRRLTRTIAVSLMAGTMAITAQPAQATSYAEGFDDVSKLTTWKTVNLSSPAGTTTWRQGEPDRFPAHSGAASSYIAIDWKTSDEHASNWLITPMQGSLSSTDAISFFTASDNDGGFPDRLEVRMSTNGSCNPGTTSAGVGDFTTLLGSINPHELDGGYPTVWTQFSYPLAGLATTNVTGCLAFRYHITDTDSHGDYIGIDSVAFVDNASTACTSAKASATTARAQVATATATVATLAKAVTQAKTKLRKAKKVRKVARKADAEAKIEKAEKKVRKAKRVLKRVDARNDAAVATLTAAQAALTASQSATTNRCP